MTFSFVSLCASCSSKCHVCTCRRGSKKNMWVTLCTASLLFTLLLLRIYQWDLMAFIGLAVFAPSTVNSISVTFLSDTCKDDMTIPTTWRSTVSNMTIPSITHSTNDSRTVPYFGQGVENVNFSLSREWKVLSENKCINTSHLDSNVCIRQTKSSQLQRRSNSDSGVVTCFPSFMIIGFEKCSTTQLLLWLSYHPNLLGKWQETRFFSTVKAQDVLEQKWRTYLKEQVTIPGGIKNIGNYWNFEKTPSSILSRQVADWVHAVTPSIRLLVMVRNPTARALSAFVMYTRHINNFNDFAATWNVKKIMYSSFVIRHLRTGQVKFAKRGGVGGEAVTEAQLKTTDKGTGPWQYISYPPTAQDFHDFLLTNQNITKKYGHFHFDSRESRVVQEGYYARFITQWLKVFPSQQFLLIPMERLWNNRTLANLNILQQMLRIPIFDYRKVTYLDKTTGRHELQSASTYFLWTLFNTGNDVITMLPESKKLLDDLYCDSNRLLQRMVSGSELKGYSCT